MTELALPPGTPSVHRRPRLGYALTVAAATLFALNGAVSKIALDGSDIGTLRWTELRATGSFVGIAVGLVILAPRRLRIGSRRELGRLALYGVVGFALVQWLYFVAIDRLPIGIGLLFEFTAPVLIALWARFVWHEPVRRRVWPALGLVLVGLSLVAQLWHGLTLDGVGVVAGLLAAGALATFYLMSERLVGTPRPDLGDLPRARIRLARVGDRPALVELPDRGAARRRWSCRTASSRCRSVLSRSGESCSGRSRPTC